MSKRHYNYKKKRDLILMHTYNGTNHFTVEDIGIAESNGISVTHMLQRKKLGWSLEDIITRPVAKKGIGVKKVKEFKTVKSQFFTEEEQKQGFANGVPYKQMVQRLRQGWSKHEILTVPVGGSQKKMQKKELLEVVGRIKFMQNSNLLYPPPITALMQKRLDEYGTDIGEVEEVYVDLSDIPREGTPEIPETSLEIAY